MSRKPGAVQSNSRSRQLVLVTHNRSDFERLHRSWLEAARSHSGIIATRRRLPTELARKLGRLLVRLPAESFANQLFYV
jgi:hypothetical protein